MDLVTRIRQELALDVSMKDGRPCLDLSMVKDARWPRKVNSAVCIAIDPYGPDAERRWPLPRFEILIANLDSIGLKAVAVGIPGADQSDERLARVVADFSDRYDAVTQAGVISKCIMWVGHDTVRRHIAAAVGIPQVVLLPDGGETIPAYGDTIFVKPSSGKAESKVLGPLSVADVAEAVTAVLKKLGAQAG
jgi:ADP-heptose:LPS heptosyltransferase